jgi:integrase
MAQKVKRLTAQAVLRENKPGLYHDGAGLYLRVGRGGAKSWAFRYMRGGVAREMGLGGLTKVSLANARSKADAQRKLLSDGADPLVEKAARQKEERFVAAGTRTFEQCAESYIEAQSTGWRSAKHAAQWTSTLRTYVYPVFGDLPVRQIDRVLVIEVIDPIWLKKPETARRIRGRIEAIMDFAIARGWRGEGDNPARRGPLVRGLSKQTNKVKHHAALPYTEIGSFMVHLRKEKGTAAAALEFLILTAGRTGEVISARWREIDSAKRVWHVPAERMKSKREHRVPLSVPALNVLERLPNSDEGLIFPGLKTDRPLSNMALLVLLGRMKRSDLTVHGFRSSFRDWAAEQTNFPTEVAEMALAHVVGSKVEAAYRRGDMFEKRRRLMDAWAEFLTKAPAKSSEVVSLRAG